MADRPIESSVAAEAAVRAAAARSRLAVAADAVPGSASRLRADVDSLAAGLRGVRLGVDGVAVGVGAGGMPLRADGGAPYAMTRDAALLAASSRLGYILVPRLASDAASPPVARDGAAPAVSDPVADDAFAAELESGA